VGVARVAPPLSAPRTTDLRGRRGHHLRRRASVPADRPGDPSATAGGSSR
jgi:hypothetical protein